MTTTDTDNEFDAALETARTVLSGEHNLADALEANRLVSSALVLRPTSAEAWILKSQALSDLNDHSAALAAVEMALNFDPGLVEAHYWRTAILSDLNRYEEALVSVERCFRYLDSDHMWLLEGMYCEKAMILDSLGRTEEAVTAYETGLECCPNSSLLRTGLAPLRRAKLRSSFTVLDGGKGPRRQPLQPSALPPRVNRRSQQ